MWTFRVYVLRSSRYSNERRVGHRRFLGRRSYPSFVVLLPEEFVFIPLVALGQPIGAGLGEVGVLGRSFTRTAFPFIFSDTSRRVPNVPAGAIRSYKRKAVWRSLDFFVILPISAIVSANLIA